MPEDRAERKLSESIVLRLGEALAVLAALWIIGWGIAVLTGGSPAKQGYFIPATYIAFGAEAVGLACLVASDVGVRSPRSKWRMNRAALAERRYQEGIATARAKADRLFRERKEGAAKLWWGQAQYPLPPNQGGLLLVLHRPDNPNVLVSSDATADCVVSRGAKTWARKNATPIPLDPVAGSFFATFPEDFAGFESPLPSASVIHYIAWWESDAVEGRFRHQEFWVAPNGMLLLEGLDPDHPKFRQP